MSEPQVLCYFGAVADRDDLLDIHRVQRETHDLLVADLGDARASGVMLFENEPDEAVLVFDRMGLEPALVDGCLKFLRANPKGLLITAMAEVKS